MSFAQPTDGWETLTNHSAEAANEHPALAAVRAELAEALAEAKKEPQRAPEAPQPDAERSEIAARGHCPRRGGGEAPGGAVDPRPTFPACLPTPIELGTFSSRRNPTIRISEAIVWHEETALLLAAILPLVSREMLFHLSDEEEAEGFPITAVYGEQGSQVAGWLRRFEPGLVGALHLAEALARNPPALAAVLQASGGGATEQVGCILARGEEREER